MPDTFGKRQRDAAKAKRRGVKEARRAARKSGQLYADTPDSDAPFDGSAEERADVPRDENGAVPHEQA
jgi:hypothetical protein